MPLDPARLAELRKRRKLSRSDLAEKAKISVRQIARLESASASSGPTPRGRTVNQLAKALDVEPGVLLGDLPMPDLRPKEEKVERVQISALLWPEIRLAYALIKRRYGVNPTTLFNAAPLMFVLLAEGSLLWRKEKVKEVEEAADQLHNLGSGHLSFAKSAHRPQDGVYAEKASIEKGDIFGKDIHQDAIEFGYDRSTNNPFSDYLRELAEKIGKKDVIKTDELELVSAALDGFPDFNICEGDLEKISGGSSRASLALKNGDVRIADIPDELWADEASEKRRKWLEERLSERWKAILDSKLDIKLDLPGAPNSIESNGEGASQ